nr:TPA_asm: m44.7 sORF 2 [Murid betaherpesvirus 1]DBA07777.1 TPA_asm: m44.7 sORF 2 [Murid betaherpesvirus 1]
MKEKILRASTDQMSK